MTLLLWGEQLKKAWEAKKSTPRILPSPTIKCIDKWNDATSTRWDLLVCTESEFAKIPAGASAGENFGIVAVIGAKNAKADLHLPESLWNADCHAALGFLSTVAGTYLTKRSLEKTLRSLGESQEQLADSTALLVHKLEQHIQIAAEIQRSLLPATLPKIPGVSVSARFFPSHGLGGDYYDVFEFGDKKRFGFLLADSQTHGMAAALLSALLKIRIEQIREDFTTAGDFLVSLGKHILSEIPVKSADLHLLYGIFDRSSLEFRFASAGALRPVLFRSGRLSGGQVDAEGPLRDQPLETIPENEWKLEPGDYLMLASKGLDNLTAPNASESWIGEHLARHEQWPDLLDVQNEIAALANDSSRLTDDVTIIQLSIDPKTLYLKRS